DLEPILKPTYGVILYQEQVMQIAQVLASFTLGGADMLRRAMGKKKPEEMEKQRGLFMEGSGKNGVDADQATYIFDLMEKFAGYGFNKSHSAAYALVSFQTTWLKTHYPAAFMAAVLSADLDNTDKVVMMLDDCRQLELTVLPPDINQSEYQFTVNDDDHIVYGLGAVKGAGESAISLILDNRREGGQFTSLLNLCQRIASQKVTRRVLETLIKAGVLDSLTGSRRAKLEFLPEALRMAEQYHRDQGTGQTDLFGGTIAPAVEQSMPDLPEWDEKQRLRLEKETLGLYLTGHPINEYEAELKAIVSHRLVELVEIDTNQRYQKEPVMLSGLVASMRIQSTDRGKRAFVQLDDKSAYYELMLFSDVIEQFGHLLEKEAIVVLEGTLDSDYRTESVRLRVNHIYSMQEMRESLLRKLQLTVTAQQVEQGLMANLQGFLTQTEEPRYPVIISYQNPQACADIRLSSQLYIPLSDSSLRELRQVMGQDAVQLVY
ncbi:MAG: DNA polymerase III alpha subunit (EC, partial [uncultured Thiotrichaceae bacterium]